MPTRSLRNLSIMALVAAAFTGCASAPEAPPMETNGPNQVVLRVPGMS